jgi:hypothetical protein
MSGGANPTNSAAADASGLTEVEDREVADALTTMNASKAFLAQFRERKDGCRPPLAWVSLVSAPGEPPGHARLISGNYYSPVFEVSAAPMRVAIPFPAPYDAGRGVLTAIDTGGSAVIALTPAWRVSAQEGKTTRAVTWRPVKRCGQRNG